eukprot:79876_1
METQRPLEQINNEIITYGDKVRIKKKGQGKIRYLGVMEGKKRIYYGIELEKKNGKYDGSFLGKKYFECDARKGLFITISDIEKLIKKSRNTPRITINSTIYINKYNDKGIIKYIGIPYNNKNKSKSIYYGIALNHAKGKNNGCIGKKRYFKCENKHGIFVKKDQITIINNSNITPGAPESVSNCISDKSSKRINARKQRQNVNNNKGNINRSKSINAKTKRKLKKKSISKTSNNNKSNKILQKKVATFHRNIKSKNNKCVSSSSKRSKSVVKRKKRASSTGNIEHKNGIYVSKKLSKKMSKLIKLSVKDDKKLKKMRKNRSCDDEKVNKKVNKVVKKSGKARTKSATRNKCVKKVKVNKKKNVNAEIDELERIESELETEIEIDNIEREEKGQDDFYDGEEIINGYNETEEEREAMKVIEEALGITDYTMFLGYIDGIKDVICKLGNDKYCKKRVLNATNMQSYDNDIMIWQNILHLSLFVVKSMHSVYNLDEKKQLWDFIDFLLQNGSNPLIKMTIKQEDTYEYKNVFKLMNEALAIYKQNDMLIVKRLKWLWSLVYDMVKYEDNNNNIGIGNMIFSDCEDEEYIYNNNNNNNNNMIYRLNKPAILTINSSYNNHWIIADGYNELPTPNVLKEYFNFGCDIIHFCSDDEIYYNFNQIRMSLPPGLMITTLRINYDMRFYLDLIGRCVLYYKYYISLRCKDMINIYQELMNEYDGYTKLNNKIIEEIIGYCSMDIIY